MVDLKITIQARDDSTATLTSLEGSFDDLFKGIRDALGDLKKAFEKSAEDIADSYKDLGSKLSATARGGGGLPGLGPIASMLGGGLFKLGGFVFSAMKNVVSIVGKVLSGVVSVVTSVFSIAFKAVVSIAGTILSGITGAISLGLRGLGAVLDTFLLTPFKIVFNKITALAATIGVGVGFKFAADFQDSLSVAFALIPREISPVLRTSMQRTLEDIRAVTGASGKELGRALFTAISTGFGEASPILVGAAAKLAAVGEEADDVGSTTQVLAGILRAYNLEAKDAVKIADMLQKTQQLGNITNAEVAMQLGRVISAAKGSNVSLKDLLATISLATVKGMTAEQTFTGLLGAIIAFSAPTPEAKKKLSDLNVSLHTSSGEFIGLYDAIQKIAGLNLDIQRLREIIPERMARNFFIAISSSLDKYRDFITQIEKASGVLDDAMEERNRSISRGFEKMAGNMANIFSTILTLIEEEVGSVFGFVSEKIGTVTTALRKMKDEGRIDTFKTAIGDIVDKFVEWLPTLEQVVKFFKDLGQVGLDAFQVVKKEFNVIRQAFEDFFHGRDADLSQSILITGMLIAFEEIKIAATKSFNWIRGQFKDIINSETMQGFAARAEIFSKVIAEMISSGIRKGLREVAVEGKVGFFAKTGLGEWLWGAEDWEAAGGNFQQRVKGMYAVLEAENAKAAQETRYRMIDLQKELAALPPIAIGKFKIETGDLDDLKNRMRELLAAAKEGAPQIDEVIDAVKEPLEGLFEAQQQQTRSLYEIGGALDIEFMRYLAEGQKAAVADIKSKMRELTVEQTEYMEAQGDINKAIVDRYNELLVELRSEKQMLKIILDELKE